jgi:hypothetical protein
MRRLITTEDLVQFWSKAIPSLQVHPEDAATLNANRHALALDALVGPWMGPIRTAPVVLLTLNGGLAGTGEEARAARMPAARESAVNTLSGDAPLPDWVGNPAGRVWTQSRLAQFGLSYAAAATKVAFVNLIPYRSKDGAFDKHMINRLESCRMVWAWARDTLFPAAEAGERIVVCLRSARDWGLEPASQRGKSLFSPKFTRSGYMHHGAVREIVGTVVRRAVYTPDKTVH